MTYGGCTTEQLADKVPEESARNHLFRFKHTHQGDYRESGGQYMVLTISLYLSCFISVHLLQARVLCAYQGEDDVLQLQECRGGCDGEDPQHPPGEEGGGEQWV